MKAIIDANVVMAMLINPGKPLEVFFEDRLEIFAPEFLLEELQHYQNLILDKSRFSPEELNYLFSLLQQKIKFIPEEEFVAYFNEADKTCPDPDDIDYFALALHLKIPLWSNDKKLKEQSKVMVYSTAEIMSLLTKEN